MKWYSINDPSCNFANEGGKIFGTVNGKIYELTNNGFEPVKGVKKNPYMPDEITEPLYQHAKMIPHHLAYVKGKAAKLKKKILKRNGPFIPNEVKSIITTHAKMLPHHIAYAKGVAHSKFGRMSSLED
jgi:hypothetical protein